MTSELNTPGVFDKIVGKAKEFAGTVLGDDDLKREGHLHEERAAANAEALQKEAAAEGRAEEADVIARQRELAAESARLAAEEAAERNAEQLERERKAAEAKAAAEQREHAAELHNRDANKEVAVDLREAAAVRDRLVAESEAQRLEREALEARQLAQALDPATTPQSR